MKMKKLLSMGALALVLASSVSIGASAADTSETTSKTALLIQIVAKQYNDGTNQTGLFSGVNKGSKVDSVISEEFATKVKGADEVKDTKTAGKYYTKYENNKGNDIATALGKVVNDYANFEEFKADLINVLTKLQGMDSISETSKRETLEKDFRGIVKAYDKSNLDVTFGKNAAGKTTASIINRDSKKLIVQLNADELTTVINKVKDTTWGDVQAERAK